MGLIETLSLSDYFNYIKNTNIRKPIAKIELLRVDETAYSTITGDIIDGSGSLNIENKNGQRRSISFSLININKDYLPNPDKIWLRQKVRVHLGFEIDGEDFYLNQGVFVLENPSAISGPAQSTIDITALDKFSLLDGTLGGELNGIYQIPVGTTIIQIIKNILQPTSDFEREVAWDPMSPVVHQSLANLTTPYTMEKPTGEPIGEFLIELANMVSANVYYDVDGRLHFEPDYDDSLKGVAHSFSKGDYNYINSRRDYPLSKVYNAVLVIGDNINGDLFTGLARNEDARSPTSIYNVGFYRVLKIEDTNIYSDELALIRAKYELKRVTNLLAEQSIESVPFFHLDVDQIIEISDDQLDLDKKKMLINSISIPFSASGSMSITCVESIDVSFEN